MNWQLAFWIISIGFVVLLIVSLAGFDVLKGERDRERRRADKYAKLEYEAWSNWIDMRNENQRLKEEIASATKRKPKARTRTGALR